MIKLKKIEILKYKSFTTSQIVEIEDDLTVLVGMNESGKTSVLECLAKTNYFEVDSKFKFNQTLDYPRKEKKAIDKSGQDPTAIISTYELSDHIIKLIENKAGKDSWLGSKQITITSLYSGCQTIGGIKVDLDKFISHVSNNNLSNELAQNLKVIKTKKEFENLTENYPDEDLEIFSKYFSSSCNWSSFADQYIYNQIITPNLPKFIYYDEYYQLPSRIVLEDLISEGEEEISDELKTAKALLDLAEIDIEELIQSDDFEEYIAELEATEATISDTLFAFWSANKNLNIEFKIDKKLRKVKRNVSIHGYTQEVEDIQIAEHVLDIRVKNSKTRVSLPLQNRSKGFNWFFSFLVWFNKIQADNNSTYILLLDEPGLNLHATAQADLLNFLESLTDRYQIIYTTHSPFMVQADRLHRVRTVFSDSDTSIITESIQQKDPNTLFPLQAALGYDIAQNLFISKKNLLVEGVSDLMYLTQISEYLKSLGRIGLNDDITIVPSGGLDKVASFISLLRGSKLSIFCLLDSFTDQKAKSKLDRMISEKIIADKNIKFFHEFLENRLKADIEDIFSINEYLKLFNLSFKGQYPEIKETDLDSDIEGILSQINKVINKSRFNHYLPAKSFTMSTEYCGQLSKETLERFENIFKEINKQLK
ncbi:AAA family ATPase [Acinetobacter faecalis]|uniref:AAA family ATPase n=1 Tax=Acinetobacter faecalis TaxID=2665161 RepID=UPI002A920870|nr:AAA family ATPase [Acinetobacter faecalis]MDY6484444.1 AAA family ATPase [Acinetobacter faecalis]